MTSKPSSEPQGKPETLAEVLDRVLHDENLSKSRRKQVGTHLRTFARVQGKRLEDLPSDPKAHRPFLKRFHPAKADFSKRHWENVISSLRFALHHSGILVIAGRSREALSLEWQTLYDRLDDQHLRARVSRFMRYCSARDIYPQAVNDVTLERFLEVLRDESFAREPERAQRLTIRAWNRAVDEVLAWPSTRLTLPDRRRHVTLPLSEFPPTFAAEVETWLDTFVRPDPLAEIGPNRQLSADTIAGRKYQIRCFAAALTAVGKPTQQLRELQDLFDPERFKDAVRYLYHHYTKRKTTYRILQTLRLIARDHLQLDERVVTMLTDTARRIGVEAPGLTEKNRQRLRQFDDTKNVANLIHLPARLLKKARRLDRTRRNDSLPVQIALAIEILIFAPIRLGNLARLRIDKHFHWSRAGRKGICHLVIPAEEVKNGVPLEFPLPRDLLALLQTYLDDYRPRLTSADDPWLFPGRAGGHKTTTAFRSQISKTVLEETGLEIHPHLFRHIAAKLHLEANPGEYEIVRRILGHTDIRTTTNFYAGTEGAAAARHYDRTILGLRDRTATML